MASKKKKSGPTHRVFANVKEEKQESFLVEIGALWPHADGRGFDLIIEGWPMFCEPRFTIREFGAEIDPVSAPRPSEETGNVIAFPSTKTRENTN